VPQVVTLTNGNFVVAWQDEEGEAFTSNGNFRNTSFRIFDSAGVPIGAQQGLNGFITFDQISPSIATTAGGGFVAVWASAHNANAVSQFFRDQVGIYGQSFDANGQRAGFTDFQLMQSLTQSAVNERNPSVTVLPDGKFVVVYESVNTMGEQDWNIVARVFNAVNSPFTDEFIVSTQAAGQQQNLNPTVVATTGGFVISWQDFGANPDTIRTVRYAYDSVIRGATLDGGVGNDVLTDGAGDAVLLGGAGNDTLTGGAGADSLTGSAGADRFVISATSAFGADTIADYSAAQGDVLMATTPFVFSSTLDEIRAGMSTIAGAPGALLYTSTHGSVRINGAGTAASMILGG
jgi:hypothetical protein